MDVKITNNQNDQADGMICMDLLLFYGYKNYTAAAAAAADDDDDDDDTDDSNNNDER